jgi:GNAT superfamily N-acetyltransferase
MIPATIDGAPLRRQLAAAGYGLEHPHHVYVLDTRSARPRANGGFFSVDAVDSLPRLLEWYRVADAAFGEPRARTDDELAFDLALCRGGGPTDRALVARVYRVVARDREDAAIACAAMTLFPTLRFALFWGAATLAHARGQGAYTQLVNARLSRARALGIEVVGLYARNETSAPIVARQGFVKHGPMDMWWRPGVHESGQ